MEVKTAEGLLTGDFFTLPKETQIKFYKNLPPSIIRDYYDHFRELENLTEKEA